MGVKVEVELERPGFYPAGGGKMHISIETSGSLLPLYLDKSVGGMQLGARAVCAELPGHIGHRELKIIEKKLMIGEGETELVEYPAQAAQPLYGRPPRMSDRPRSTCA